MKIFSDDSAKAKIEDIHINVETLVLDLSSEDSDIREKARHTLSRMGEGAIAELRNYIHSEHHIQRWEVAKTLGEIGSPAVIPLLMEILEDPFSSIRWLAAEGLVRVGAPAIRPILEALIENPDSVLLRNGAHHVFKELVKNEQAARLQPLLTALDAPGPAAQVPVLADTLLRTVYAG